MKKLHIGMIVCVLAIAILVQGCSPYEYEATSVEHLRELIAEAETRSNAVDVVPSQSNTPVATQPANYANQSYKTNPEYKYDRDYLGYVPSEYYGELTEAEKRGLQTWYFWNGGNEKFFRDIAKETRGIIDFLSLVDARPDSELAPGDKHHIQHNERFKEIGVINNPECKAAKKPDEYGLWLDQCDKDPHAAGVMGVVKFANPNFDPEKWDVEKYYAAGEEKGSDRTSLPHGDLLWHLPYSV